MLQFTVEVIPGRWLTENGTVTEEKEEAFLFRLRESTMRDERAIAEKTRELAGDDVLAYAELMAGEDILLDQIRRILREVASEQVPSVDETLDGDALLAAVNAREKEISETVQRIRSSMLKHTDDSRVKRAYALMLEAADVRGYLTDLDLAARWFILSDAMPESHRNLETVPGWEQCGGRIVAEYRAAQEQAQKNFLQLSGFSEGLATLTMPAESA